MKKLLIVLGLAVLTVQAQAEDHSHDHSFDYSVFREFRFLKPVDGNAMNATHTLVATTFPGWSAEVDKLNSNIRDMFGAATQVAGGTNADKAYGLMNGKLSKFGVNTSEWQMTRNQQYGHVSYVDFSQKVDGHEVVFSRLSFRFTPKGELVRVKMRTYAQPEASLKPQLTTAAALTTDALTTDLKELNVTSKKVDANWVWFPVPTVQGYIMRPAYKFEVIGTFADDEFPALLEGYIDAITGDLLYRMNNVQETFEVKVQAEVYKTSRNNPLTTEPLADMRVSIGGNVINTDATGTALFNSLNAPQTATMELRGPWSKVNQGGGGGPTPSATVTFNSATNTYTFPTTGSANVSDINAFYHVNVIHDFMKHYLPTFTGMDFSLPTNVDLTNNSCNAFYNGTSINFYAASGNCRSFAEVGDIVYHEYGHGINREYYGDNGVGFMRNGSLNEGYADVWALGISQDGIVGDGSFISGGQIRDYTGNPKVFPIDLRGEVHADGEIIGGAWWDVAVNIGSVDTMMQLFSKGYTDLPDGPLGTEGEIYHDVLISALMDDDDDANLSNGTPHFQQIAAAFARHGIYLMSDAVLNHAELAHQAPGQAIDINASLILSNPVFFQDLKLIYRVRGAQWDTLTMTNTGGTSFTSQIPAQPLGTIIDYYFGVYDYLNTSVSGLPNGYTGNPSLSSQVTLPFQFGVGISERTKEDFEGPATGWTMGLTSDDATSGVWVKVKPVGTFSGANFGNLPVQTGADHTTGSGECMVTGNNFSTSAGAADVDRGRTTLETPVISLAGFFDPVVEYYRWYSNDRAASSPSNVRSDYWQVQIGISNSFIWKNVDYTKQSDHSWRRRIFKVSEYWTNAQDIQLRFIASDIETTSSNDGQNIVEGAVDDFIIYDGAPLGVANTAASLRADIFPNPADDRINIVLPTGMTGTMQLLDITGKMISQQNVIATTTNYSFDTKAVAAGTYMLFIQTDKAIENRKVVIGHK